MFYLDPHTLCGYAWVAFGTVWLVSALRVKPVQQHTPLSERLSYVVPDVAAFYLMFGGDMPFEWLNRRILPSLPWIQWSGFVITLAGVAFAFWARFYLGQNWSGRPTVKVGHELVRTGPYRWVRHPIYTGILLALFGTYLVNGKWRGLFAVLLLWFGFTVKSRIEERLMVTTFGEQYADYRRTTGALIPRLWARG